jgi:hypothetical protein
MSSSHSSQFPPKSIVKNKSYEGVEALRQIASTSLFLDNEQQRTGAGQQVIPTIKEPEEGSSNASLINLMPQAHDAILEPPIELKKMDTLKIDTLNVIDILSLTDEETEREIHQIDINKEIVIPKIEPGSLFSDEGDDEEESLPPHELEDVDSEGNKKTNKLNRQRTSLNQSKAKEADTLLMETSLMIIDPVTMSPPPYTPPPLPLSPNIVTTTFNIPSTLSLTLPLTSTTTSDMAHSSSSQQQSKKSSHHHKHHHHHHHHKGSQHKHRHSTAVGRTAANVDDRGQPIKDSHQLTEAELVLSPSKLGQ